MKILWIVVSIVTVLSFVVWKMFDIRVEYVNCGREFRLPGGCDPVKVFLFSNVLVYPIQSGVRIQ